MTSFPWIKSYPAGVPHKCEDFPFDTLLELFESATKKYQDRIAFENMGVKLSYREVDALSTDFAAFLQQDLKLKKGERIAVQIPNLLQFPVVVIGAIKAGLIVVNTNPLYTATEMEHQFINSEVSAIVILANFAHNLEKIRSKIPAKHIIVTHVGDLLGPVKGRLINFVLKLTKRIPSYRLDGALSLSVALKKGSRLTWEKPTLSPDDTVLFQYTGGTTGVSKAAQLSHRNLVQHTIIINSWFAPVMNTDSQYVIITAIPMYHIFAFSANKLWAYHVGGKSVLITNPKDVNGFVKELFKHKFNIFTGVNTLYNALLNHPKFKDLDFSHLQLTIAGGMALHEIVAQRWETVTKVPIIEGYGLSETSPVLCCNPLDGNHRIGYIGLPIPNTEVGIFDDHGNLLPAGQEGEICARGPQVMKGYWQSDNTDVFYRGDWFRTGDIGVMEEDGFFKIVDRKKDMIQVSGFNVYPNEVEDVISKHPKVLEVAVVGIPDKNFNESVKAFIVKRDDTLTEDEIKEHCERHLTRYKVPKIVAFKTDLPKSNVGKIVRRLLKEESLKH